MVVFTIYYIQRVKREGKRESTDGCMRECGAQNSAVNLLIMRHEKNIMFERTIFNTAHPRAFATVVLFI